MQQPRVTALINAYNYGRYIAEAIQSVLAQEFPADQLEALVVDDGSTDNTREVVARFGERVRYLHKPNGGQASALNLGFAEARGEYVALLDADDKWRPGKLQRVMREFDRNPEAGMVYHALRYWEPQYDREWDDHDFPCLSGDVPSQPLGLLRYGVVSTSGITLRKTAAQRLLPIPDGLRIYADSYIGYVMPFVAVVVALPDRLTSYRHHDQNHASVQTFEPERLRLRWECYKLAIERGAEWLQHNCWDMSHPGITDYLHRHRLVEQNLRFGFQPPGRGEFHRYLAEHNRLYAPLWTPGYRAFRHAIALAGLLLGYRGFAAARRMYGGKKTLLRLRRQLVADHDPSELAGTAGLAQ